MDIHEGDTLEQVEIVLGKAVDAYHSMLAANQVKISMLSAGTVRRKNLLSINVLNQRIRSR